jgi:urease accessory protein UreF
MSMMLSASENPSKKNIYTADELDKAVKNTREQRKNNRQAWRDFLSKGNRIDHEPNHNSSILKDQNKS